MRKQIISLHGSYFGNNYGDTLLVCLFAEWLKEICPDYVINLPLANEKKTKDLPDGKTGIFNLLRSRFLVYCGGGYFGEQPKNTNKWARRNFVRHGIIGIIAIVFRIPYAIIGVEFGPISSKWFRRFCVYLAKKSHTIVVRNIESKRYLEHWGVDNVLLSADAVLSLSDIVAPLQSTTNNIIVHIPGINNSPSQYNELVKSIIQCIEERKELGRLLFINDSFSNIYQTKSYKLIFELLDAHKIPYSILPYTGYKHLIELINSNKYVITTKLHVGITAAALNKRPLSFWLHPKTKRLHEQIGNANYCYPINTTCSFYNILTDYFSQSDQYILPDYIKNQALLNKQAIITFIDTIR